ncbi:MAG: ABC transporter ATP-binding protein, partial [Candidatus Paceibacterales bacterium]
MIDILNLSYIYPPVVPKASPVVALDNISLHIPAGKCIAITGANNCGKTTFCLAIGLGVHFSAGKLTGTIHVDRNNLGIVFQSPMGQLFNATIEDEIAWGLENIGLPPAEIEQRIDEVLAMVHLEHLPRDRVPHSLSGGEQKKLILAAVLALRPKILILDEPSAGLSPQARLDMITVLKNLRETQGVTILLAEKDSEVIVALADEIIVLDKGAIVKKGKELSSRHCEGALLRPKQSILNILKRKNGLPRPAKSAGLAMTTSENIAIEFKNLHFSYDTQPILKNINLNIPQGQFVALLGDNGVGKTTLSRLIIGLLRPKNGLIRILGENTAQQTTGQLAKKIGLAFQDPELQ